MSLDPELKAKRVAGPAEAPPVPCGSCPYRRDVPSGIWDQSEYDKLPEYDGETWEQSCRLFMCHQRDGCLCGGWLACHGPGKLLALRFAAIGNTISPSVFDYTTDVSVFASGAEAREHGLREIKGPGHKAQKMIAGLTRKDRRATMTTPTLRPRIALHLESVRIRDLGLLDAALGFLVASLWFVGVVGWAIALGGN